MKKASSQNNGQPPKKSREYTVLIGCNTSDETRYEIGDTLKEKDVKPSDIKELLEMGAIELK